jgi:hypothetical protein
MNRLRGIARKIEFAVAGVLTLEVVALHFNVMRHAGPLWRDEISSLNLATKPTLTEFWSSLTFDPVPALFFFILRVWHSLGWGGSDQGLRHLGFLIGLGVVAAIWMATWFLKKSPPTWALLLFGLSPVALVWGDSLRAYGLSCFWNILTVGLLWRLLGPRPRTSDIALAGAAALCSVHSLFPNALLLFAAGAGAIAVALRRRWWRTASILAGIGATAGLSLLPYAPIIRRTQNWSTICKTGIDFPWIFTMIHRAISTGGSSVAWMWIALAVLACVTILLAIVKPAVLKIDEGDKDLLLYAGLTLGIALGAIVCFFRLVGWTTSLWYYLPLLGTAALCLDAISKIFAKSAITLAGSSVAVIAVAGCATPLVYEASNVRLTNIDLTANAIAQHAQPSDLVVVDNFFYAVSFHRYYHGKAPCLSVPGVSDLGLHRWDLLKSKMSQSQPLKPILDRIEQTLQSGHAVYVVGFAPLTRTESQPPDLAPAPQTASRWQLGPYIVRWTSQIAYAVQAHAVHGMIISVPCGQPVSEGERVRAFVVSGWKEAAVAIRQ